MAQLSQFCFTTNRNSRGICGFFTSSLLLVTLLCTPFTATAQSTQKVLVLGDSLSAGFGMTLDQAWPALLEERLQTTSPDQFTVINASISGETSEGGVRRFPNLLNQFEPDWLLLELGANDGLRGYPITTISANLERIIRQAQTKDIQVVLMGIQIPPNYGERYSKPFFAQYAELSQRFNTQLVPFILEDVALEPSLMLPDGLHPTPQAQPIIVDNVLRHVNFNEN